MRFLLFNDKILTTPKCGTRYLRQRWSFLSYRYNEIINFLNIEYLIIREPIEHLKSALHTEFYNHESLYNYDLIDFSNYLDKLILKKEVVHWSYNMYEILYWVYIKNNKKTKIIHLSVLTDFMKEQGVIIPYDPSDYTFNDYENWMSKDDFFNKLLKDFPTQMEILLKQSDEQTIFYNKIINNTTQQQSLI
jgi:hypothetical protein